MSVVLIRIRRSGSVRYQNATDFCILKVTEERSRIRIYSSEVQIQGSGDPDSHQNVTDPQPLLLTYPVVSLVVVVVARSGGRSGEWSGGGKDIRIFPEHRSGSRSMLSLKIVIQIFISKGYPIRGGGGPPM